MMLQKHELNKNITSDADPNPLVRGTDPWVRIRTSVADPDPGWEKFSIIFSDPD